MEHDPGMWHLSVAAPQLMVSWGLHVPLPSTLQAWQLPQSWLLQQTRSVQKRFPAHSLRSLQLPPADTRPQRKFVPQVFGARQSSLVEQALLQALVPLH
jgi:hypothetical protein